MNKRSSNPDLDTDCVSEFRNVLLLRKNHMVWAQKESCRCKSWTDQPVSVRSSQAPGIPPPALPYAVAQWGHWEPELQRQTWFKYFPCHVNCIDMSGKLSVPQSICKTGILLVRLIGRSLIRHRHRLCLASTCYVISKCWWLFDTACSIPY